MARIKSVCRPAGISRAFTPGRWRLFHCEALEARRLLAAGDLDRSFSDDGMAEVNLGNGMTLFARDVLVQLDGKTVIVGSSTPEFYSDNNGDRFVVARLLLDGSLDPSFGPNGTGVVMTSIDADAHAYGATLQDDGKIIVVGTALETSGINNYQHAVVRYNPDGSPDRSFDGDGIIHFNVGADTWWNSAHDVVVQRDGKIVVVGEFFSGELDTDEEFSILRFNPDGSPDLSFGFLGLRVSDFDLPRDPTVALDYNGTPASNPYYGSIVVAGWDRQDGSALVLRLKPNGDFDDGFDHDGQASFSLFDSHTAAFDVIAQPGGKIVVAGTALNDFMLARFNPDGTFDPTFGDVGSGVVTTRLSSGRDVASSIVVSGDRLLVGGSCNNQFSESGDFGLARYTKDGLLDTSFSSDGVVQTTYQSNEAPRLAAGPGRRFTVAGGPHFHAMRFLGEGANMVAIGSFDPNGGSESGEQAHFLVTRTERLPTPLRVYLSISGTAAAPIFFFGGEDYNANGFAISAFTGASFVDIPANQTVVSVSITPVDDTLAEGDETAGFSIVPDPSYDIGTPAGVTLEIHDNDASTVYAVEDAHVRADAPAANFGAANLLETLAGDAAAGSARETYLKFDTSLLDLRRFSSVRLGVFGRLTGGPGPAVPVEVFGVSASGWGENAITFNNRPPPSTTALATAEVGGTPEFPYTFDVTEFVNREKAAGRDVVTLLLRNAAVSAEPTLWSSRFSEYSDPRLIVTGSIAFAGGTPRVTQVFAGGTAWTPAFRKQLEDAGLGDSAWGYAVRGGAEQLTSLPWGDVDTFSVRFTTGVNVVQEHLAVRGVRGGEYAFSGFTYDPTRFVATWTLATPLARGGEKVVLDLDGDIGTGVSSVSVRPRYLDGEWADGADAYDSGNGAEGGDFRFGLNTLRGDVNRDGRVNGADLYALRARLLRRASEPFSGAPAAYSPLYDLDGNGRVNTQDLTALRAALFSQLPAASPPAPAAAPPAIRRVPAVRQQWWTDDAGIIAQ